MTALDGEVWRLGSGSLLRAPIAGGDFEGVSAISNLCRYAGMVRPNGIHCLSTSTTAGDPRLYRVTDATGEVLVTPEPIDAPTASTYPVGFRLGGVAWDGTRFIAGSAAANVLLTGTDPTFYYAIDLDGTVTALGSNAEINDVAGLAVDDTYIYVAGRVGPDEGVYRITRAGLSDPAQSAVLLHGGVDIFADDATLVADSNTQAGALYFRTSNDPTSDVRVIVAPRAATPAWTGVLWRAPGTGQNSAFGTDPVTGALWLIHTGPPAGTFGNWVRLD